MNVKISALISLYNSEIFIDDFLIRLSKIINLDEIEFIFIINGDLNGVTTQKVKNFAANKKIIITELETLYKSWNRGIEVSSGKYLCNMNCDDYHYYDSLLIMSNGLDRYQTADLCAMQTAGTSIPIDDFDNLNDRIKCGNFDYKKLEYTFFSNRHCGPNPMWRKSVHNHIGVFDEKYKASGDHEMWIRMLANGSSFIKCSHDGVIYYDRPNTLSNRLESNSCEEINFILEKYGLEKFK